MGSVFITFSIKLITPHTAPVEKTKECTVGSRVWMRHLCMHLFYTYIYSYTKREERQHRWRARSVDRRK